MKIAIAILLLSFAAFAQESKYDRFKDITRVRVEVKVKDGGKPRNKLDNLELGVSFSHSGATLRKNAESFILVFSQSNRSWRYLNSHDLAMIVDGKRWDVGSGQHTGDIYRTGVFETVAFEFTRDELEKLANAKTVELQLGRYEGFIDADNIAKIKLLFAAATLPPRQK